MPITPGERLPDGTLTRMTATGPAAISVTELFAGKKAVLFGVPGAFTPVCSNDHLPSFLRHADALKQQGTDLIACMAVNDAYVMAAWGAARNVGDRILLLADGNGDYTRALGLEMDLTRFGMGMRCRRFAAVLSDGIVEIVNIDEPGAYKVSSAEFTCNP